MFERKLASNVKKITAHVVKKLRSRLLMDYFVEHDRLKNVFGLVSYSPAFFTVKDIQKIKEKALAILKEKEGTFRVETKRSDKSFPIRSLEMNALVGEYIDNNSKLKFSSAADIVFRIEINQQGVYMFLETVKCFGGLPAGVEGKVHLLVEDQASLLAGLMFMKRGCDLFPASLEEKDISLLQKFSPKELKLKMIKSLGDLQEEVLVSGQNFKNFKKYNTKLVVMRPLISYTDEMIQEELERFRA